MTTTPQPPTEPLDQVSTMEEVANLTDEQIEQFKVKPPTEARTALPTLEDILSDYRMDEISTATAIDHIQCHIDEARTTPTTREVLEELKTKLSSRMKDLDPEIADIVSKEFWNLLA